MKDSLGLSYCGIQAGMLNLFVLDLEKQFVEDVFREIRKYFRKTAKFEFFAKQIIYLDLQITRFKMIYNMFVF